jgi:hypothetical protein
MDHELLVALMGEGYDRKLFGGKVYCGEKQPKAGDVRGTPLQCFKKGIGVGMNMPKKEPELTREDYEKMTLRKLGDLAREKRIPRYGVMKKADLIDALLGIQGNGIGTASNLERNMQIKGLVKKDIDELAKYANEAYAYGNTDVGNMLRDVHKNKTKEYSARKKQLHRLLGVDNPDAMKGGADLLAMWRQQLEGKPLTEEQDAEAHMDGYIRMLSRAKPRGEVSESRKSALEQIADQAGAAADIASNLPGLGPAAKVLQGVDFANQLQQAARQTLRTTAEQFAPGASSNAALQRNFGILGFGSGHTESVYGGRQPDPNFPFMGRPNREPDNRTLSQILQQQYDTLVNLALEAMNEGNLELSYQYRDALDRFADDALRRFGWTTAGFPRHGPVRREGGAKVVMDRADYMAEHRHLISLLNSIANMASKEVKKQSSERQLKGGVNTPPGTPPRTPPRAPRGRPPTPPAPARRAGPPPVRRPVNPAVGQRVGLFDSLPSTRVGTPVHSAPSSPPPSPPSPPRPPRGPPPSPVSYAEAITPADTDSEDERRVGRKSKAKSTPKGEPPAKKGGNKHSYLAQTLGHQSVDEAHLEALKREIADVKKRHTPKSHNVKVLKRRVAGIEQTMEARKQDLKSKESGSGKRKGKRCVKGVKGGCGECGGV